MNIELDRAAIEAALPRVSSGLDKYRWLQRELPNRDVARDREYQRRFNGYYRVRRGVQWQASYYELLQRAKSKHPTLSETLTALERATGRVEASFASKLVATVDTSRPVIDSIVLRNLGLRLPPGYDPERIAHVGALFGDIERAFIAYLASDTGRYLVRRFMTDYPGDSVSEVKMLDLVLWQTRNTA